MTANQVALTYLLASVLFILSLRGLSHPLSARRGNLFGMIGMAVAILTTFAITRRFDLAIAGLGKYSRLFSSAPVVFMGQHVLNVLFVLFTVGNGLLFFFATPDRQWPPFVTMTGTAFALGILTIIPIGGADMPVVISMLNS